MVDNYPGLGNHSQHICTSNHHISHFEYTELCALWSLSCVRLFVTPRTVACQASLSVEFSRQACWNGLPFSSPEELPNPGIEPWFFTIFIDYCSTKVLKKRLSIVKCVQFPFFIEKVKNTNFLSNLGVLEGSSIGLIKINL